jgi:hypothetical protein
MKKLILIILVLQPVLQFCSGPSPEKSPSSEEPILRKGRLQRKDCFFGIHFDLHTPENNTRIGASLTEGMIDSFLLDVKPDYIQVDCKGHTGISSYPTEVGFRAAGYIGDPLQLWRKVTAVHNVSLFVHFSGIYDRKVANEYPEWTIVNADGSRSDQILSVYSPYDETYMIPQLKELAGKYGVDGAWVDGECWAFQADYGMEAQEDFSSNTGITRLPRSIEDEGFAAFLDFQRRVFKRHVTRYLDAVHQEYPRFEMTSNWAFSSMMPEPVDLDLDYLSGDLTPGNAVNRAAFEARCLASQGMPWDLMAWSFSWESGRTLPNHTKSSLQLKQELAEVMAMGGGVQVYFKQNPDISIQPWTVPLMADIATFCRERQEYCRKASPVPGIAVLYSGYCYLKNLDRVYPAWDESLRPLLGCINAVLDGQHPAEILMEHHLRDRMGEYALVIIPSWQEIHPALRSALLDYVENGGRILLIGPGPVGIFREFLGIENLQHVEKTWMFAFNGKGLFQVKGSMASFEAPDDMEVKQYLYEKNDLRFPCKQPAMAFQSHGQGRIGLIPFDLAYQYALGANHQMRDFLSMAIDELNTDPQVRVMGSRLVHVSLNRLGESLNLNLVNTAGRHSDRQTLGFDEIPKVGPLEISLKIPQKPSDIRLQPENAKLQFTWKKGRINFIIPELRIHSIVVVN